MSSQQLSLHDLVQGLEHFGDRYEALDVFARDVKQVGHALMELIEDGLIAREAIKRC